MKDSIFPEFDVGVPMPSGTATPQTPAMEWRFILTDHACRHCLGRILQRNAIFMCAVCETTCSDNPKAICGCGMKSLSERTLPRGLRQAYACGINPQRTVVNPARIVILYGGKPAEPLAIA